MVDFIKALMDIFLNIAFPTTLTITSLLIATGIMLPFLGLAVGLFRKWTRSRG